MNRNADIVKAAQLLETWLTHAGVPRVPRPSSGNLIQAQGTGVIFDPARAGSSP